MTIDLVEQAVKTLQEQGITVSQRRVLALTGGSKRDVSKYLHQLFGEGSQDDADLGPLDDTEVVPLDEPTVPLVHPVVVPADRPVLAVVPSDYPMQAAQLRLTLAEAAVGRVRTESDEAYSEVIASLLVIMAIQYGEARNIGGVSPADPRNEHAKTRFSRAKSRYNDVFFRRGAEAMAERDAARLAMQALRSAADQEQRRAYVAAHQPELLVAMQQAEHRASRDRVEGNWNPMGNREAVRAATVALNKALAAAVVEA